MYKSGNWFEIQAKTIETKCINKNGISLTFTGIEMKLRKDAVLNIDVNTGVETIDEDQYRENKQNYLKSVGLI